MSHPADMNDLQGIELSHLVNESRVHSILLHVEVHIQLSLKRIWVERGGGVCRCMYDGNVQLRIPSKHFFWFQGKYHAVVSYFLAVAINFAVCRPNKF